MNKELALDGFICLFLIVIYFIIANFGANLTPTERVETIKAFDNSLSIGKEYQTEFGILYFVYNEKQFGYADFKHSKFKGYELVDVFLSTDNILYKSAEFNYREYGVLVFNPKLAIDSVTIEGAGDTTTSSSTFNTDGIVINKAIIPVNFSTLKCTYKIKNSDKYTSDTISLENSVYNAGYKWENNKFHLLVILLNIAMFIFCVLQLWRKNKEGKISKKDIAEYTMIFILLIVSGYFQYILIK